MTDLAVGNPEIDTVGNSSHEPQGNIDGTNNQGGEATQGATAQETFIPEGVDINTLPPNVRSIVDKINKDMVRGFTEKTTKLSETIKSESAKATEAYRSKAELYDQVATQEEFVRQWNEYVQKVQATPAKTDEGNPELQQMKQQLQEMNEKIQVSEISQVTDAFADAVDEKGVKLHSDFDQLNSMVLGNLDTHEGKDEYSFLRAHIELAPGSTPQEKLANGYKAAKATYDSIFEAGKKAGMGRLQTKVLNGSNPPSHSGGDVLSVTDKKPKSAREALDMAKRGIVVSRE